jgi:hypothetical protein
MTEMYQNSNEQQRNVETIYAVTSVAISKDRSEEALIGSSRDSDSSHSSRQVKRKVKREIATQNQKEPLIQLRVSPSMKNPLVSIDLTRSHSCVCTLSLLKLALTRFIDD